jgi:hypothetical protein
MMIMGVAAGATFFACGGDGGNGGGGGGGGGAVDAGGTGGHADASQTADANTNVDAPSGQAGIGQACTPDSAGGQGDCPTGYVCLNLTNGNGPWCSKTCTPGAGDTCNQGYTGPGLAACIFNISAGSDSTPTSYCGIVCQDSTGMCPAATCNGTCPTPLLCTAELTTMQGGSAVAHACQ